MVARCAPPELESVTVTLQDDETSSTSGVLDVALNSDIVLRFDRAVSVSDGWFTVSCDGEGIVGLTATTTSDDSDTDNVEYTIGAPGGYPSGSECALSVEESLVALASNTALTLGDVEDFTFTTVTVQPFTHGGYVRNVSWSPDGSKIVSGSFDNIVRIWEASSGRLLRTLEHMIEVRSVSWSPDDSKIVSGSKNGNVHMLGGVVRSFTAHAEGAYG